MKKLLLLLIFVGSAFAVSAQSTYSNAIGLRLGWDYGITYKHFLNDRAAIEGIGTFRSWGVPGFRYNYLRVTGLYQIHNDFPDVEGLLWYYGGGASVIIWGGDYNDWAESLGEDYASLGIGIHGVIGLDYKFEDIPLNASIDWIPGFVIGGWTSGVAFGYGNVSLRYTLN